MLFVALLFFVLKENSRREEKYQDIISKLTEKFECIETGLNGIKEDVKVPLSIYEDGDYFNKKVLGNSNYEIIIPNVKIQDEQLLSR